MALQKWPERRATKACHLLSPLVTREVSQDALTSYVKGEATL